MTATADAFASFLDVLADTLDDHEAPPASLAARAHLSRFHFDRLVSAAAGEPPGALRRRILLERAAYQLITTDHDVIRVAVDAGYASNEAFTRAFRRAYGLPPARWRRQRPACGSRRPATSTSTRQGACVSPHERGLPAWTCSPP